MPPDQAIRFELRQGATQLRAGDADDRTKLALWRQPAACGDIESGAVGAQLSERTVVAVLDWCIQHRYLCGPIILLGEVMSRRARHRNLPSQMGRYRLCRAPATAIVIDRLATQMITQFS